MQPTLRIVKERLPALTEVSITRARFRLGSSVQRKPDKKDIQLDKVRTLGIQCSNNRGFMDQFVRACPNVRELRIAWGESTCSEYNESQLTVALEYYNEQLDRVAIEEPRMWPHNIDMTNVITDLVKKHCPNAKLNVIAK